MTSHLLSIITVCYNEALRIQKTINSLKKQVDQQFEWIVIDGGSADHTFELANSYRPESFVCQSEPDNGIYDAMNKGIRLAGGEYLLFLNAGDALHNDEVVSSFKNTHMEEDIIVGNLKVLMPDGKTILRKSNDNTYDETHLYWRSLPHPATFINRELFKRIGCYDPTFQIAGDWEFFTRAVVGGAVSVKSWPHCVAIFTNDGVSARMENRRLLYRERKMIRRRHYPLGYRMRRGLNETWGAIIHQFRLRLSSVKR